MLKFMVISWEPYTDDPFDIDLLSQIIRKMARRIEKLQNMRCDEELSEIVDPIINRLHVEHNFQSKFVKELIDSGILDGDFPHNLVNGYSHWWNKDKRLLNLDTEHLVI